ncbi:hypothetical protein RDABS01_027442 [Bienertia sinuspersici]
MDNLIKQPSKYSDDWTIMFPLVIWWVWKWRNMEVFDRNGDIPFDKLTFLKVKFEETLKAMHRENIVAVTKILKQEAYIAWRFPLYGWVALNTDGAAKGTPGPAGGGGLLRDYTGSCLGAFSMNLGVCNAIRAELMALKQGLLLARLKSIKKLDIRVDSEACVKLLNTETEQHGPKSQLVRACVELNRKEWNVVLSHCYREANRAADWLANRGVAQEPHIMFEDQPPTALRPFLEYDIRGITCPRMINV